MKLKSIRKEAADCRKAFKGIPIGYPVKHCHHEKFIETLNYLPEDRIRYICHDKPKKERALRLRLFRPIPVNREYMRALQAHNAACAIESKLWIFYVNTAWGTTRRAEARLAWKKADDKKHQHYNRLCALCDKLLITYAKRRHAKECPDCPWDGHTIFP